MDFALLQTYGAVAYEYLSRSPVIASVLILLLVVGIWRLGPRKLFSQKPALATRDLSAYFQEEELMRQPRDRHAYSDRTAWLLAEMSDLAYFPFEQSGGGLLERVQEILARPDSTDPAELESEIAIEAAHTGNGRKMLATLLDAKGFDLLKAESVADVQYFICRHREENYLIVAFRGSEAKVDDWYTNARAIPETVERPKGGKVHAGFLKSYLRVEEGIRECIDGDHSELPVYITGHSLGGALALLATVNLCPDREGGCYTYGAPRVANYEYFARIKTPIYRIVNSSDVVPRMPPSVIVVPVLVPLLRLLKEVARPVPFLPPALEWLAAKLDKLKDYRHFGDQRYLTDVASGRFADTKLLANPAMIDRTIWFFRDAARNLLMPVRSHSMIVYREKLRVVAHDRQQPRL